MHGPTRDPITVASQDRRALLRRALAAGAAASAAATMAKPPAAAYPEVVGVAGLDHVAIPIQRVAAMIAFNFHHPVRWQIPDFTLRAPAATPPCGDCCWV